MTILGAGDVTEWLRAPPALPDDPSLVPNIHVGRLTTS